MKLDKAMAATFLKDDSGSLTLLITSLFMVTLVLSFAIIDISGAFLAKRQLVNIGEAVISRAAHNIDLTRYYASDLTTINGSVSTTSQGGDRYLVPIDCEAANATLRSEITAVTLKGSPIEVLTFSCEGDVLRATVSAQISPTLALPILQGSVMNRALTITATIAASNEIRASN